MTLKIAFIGCVESSRVALESLLGLGKDSARVVAVMTRRASSFNSDFVDLAALAHGAGLPVLYAEDATDDESQATWLAATAPDVLFCIGWSRLLGPQVLGAAPRGVVGFHPAALPANRGRHPIVWALALGLEETASSLFLMGADPDSGPLLSQRRVAISPDDDAGALYAKVMQEVRTQVVDVAQGLGDGTLQPREQDHKQASYWRKRTHVDGQIDWRMSADGIHNLIRALARPYPGAHFMDRQQAVKVWRSEVCAQGALNVEPGKVLAVDGRYVTVKCGSQSIRLIEHEMTTLPNVGAYL